MTMTELTIAALAIDNLTHLLVYEDMFETRRQWFEDKFKRIAKLARCRFCQSFWLALALVAFVATFGMLWPLKAVLCLMAIHRATQLLMEFSDRYLNRAPTVVSILKTDDLESDSSRR